MYKHNFSLGRHLCHMAHMVILFLKILRNYKIFSKVDETFYTLTDNVCSSRFLHRLPDICYSLTVAHSDSTGCDP